MFPPFVEEKFTIDIGNVGGVNEPRLDLKAIAENTPPFAGVLTVTVGAVPLVAFR
jgi:hypothetical protein